MFFVIAKLDAPKLAKLDFILNFGITMETKVRIAEFMERGGAYQEACEVFAELPFIELLKVYKYFYWADMRLHHVTYTENKDDISEDLLNEFIDKDTDKYVKPTLLGKNKAGLIDKAKIKQQQDVMMQKKQDELNEMEYIMGMQGNEKKKKKVDVKDEQDFPTLGDDNGVKKGGRGRAEDIWNGNPFE